MDVDYKILLEILQGHIFYSWSLKWRTVARKVKRRFGLKYGLYKKNDQHLKIECTKI